MDTRRDSGQAGQPRGAARGGLRPVDAQASDALQPDGGLLVQLTTAPFSVAAYDGLRTYLAGPGRQAQAAYDRVCASTPPAGR